jgi:hypothetical protein
MTEPRENPDDDQLLDRLRAAAEEHDAVPADLAAGAKAAFGIRDVDGELAALVFDSAHEPAGVRAGAGAPRQLSFQIDAGSIEVEIDDGRIVGQLVPPASGTVSLLGPTGPSLTAEADDAGHFAFAAPPHGVVRLRATAAGRPVLTDWFTIFAS